MRMECRRIEVGVGVRRVDETVEGKVIGCGRSGADWVSQAQVDEYRSALSSSAKAKTISNVLRAPTAGSPRSSSKRSTRHGQSRRRRFVRSKPGFPARKAGSRRLISITVGPAVGSAGVARQGAPATETHRIGGRKTRMRMAAREVRALHRCLLRPSGPSDLRSEVSVSASRACAGTRRTSTVDADDVLALPVFQTERHKTPFAVLSVFCASQRRSWPTFPHKVLHELGHQQVREADRGAVEEPRFC